MSPEQCLASALAKVYVLRQDVLGYVVHKYSVPRPVADAIEDLFNEIDETLRQTSQ